MQPGWSTFACGAVLGGALGFVGGHLSVWSRVPSRAAPADWTAPPGGAAVSFGPPGSFSREAADLDDGTVWFADEPSEAGAVHALAKESAQDGSAEGAPGVLPPVAGAAPLSITAPPHPERQTVVERELHDATPQQREVWGEVLRGMPEEDAVGILRLWRTFGGRAPREEEDGGER